MASKYQWADVEKFINDNGLFFSDADLRLAQNNPDAGMSIANYKIDYNNATTDDQRALANAGAEKIRKDYGGYTGGSDGSKFYLNEPSPQNYGYQQPDKTPSSFSYDQPNQNIGTPTEAGAGAVGGGLFASPEQGVQTPVQNTPVTDSKNTNIGQYSDWKNPYQELTNAALDKVINREEYKNPYDVELNNAFQNIMNQGAYVNPYGDQQKAALDAVLNREQFNYDPTQDVAWQQAKKMYLREADRATQDTLGQAAMMTGGMPSTAAMTAASQAGDYYRGQLNDSMGEYRDRAYQQYVDDANFDYSQLDVLNNMSASDYQKYVDAVNQGLTKYNAAKDMSDSEYQKWVDALGFDADQLSILNTLGQQARDEFDTDRNFGYNQWTDELAFQTDKENTKWEREWAEAQQKAEEENYKTEYGDALSFDLYNSLLADYAETGSSDALNRARAILKALQERSNL